VEFTFTVSVPAGYVDPDTSNNVSSRSKTASVLTTRQASDFGYQTSAPSTFTGSGYRSDTTNQRSWTVWEWNGGFVRKTYTAKLTLSASLTPDITAVWKEYDSANGVYKTRSGYGLNTEVHVKLMGIPADMYTGHAKATAFYPEFNYGTGASQTDSLDLYTETNSAGYTADLVFKSNPYSVSGNRMHFTPMWFPDGAYKINFDCFDIWTPAGMLTGTTGAKVIISGSIYDDHYTQRG